MFNVRILVTVACITSVHFSAALASPQPLSVHKVSEAGKDFLVIDGKGFGAKELPSPLLWAFGKDIRQKGVASALEASVKIGADVPIGGDVNSFLWTAGKGAKFSAATRHPDISHTYFAKGNGWVGWPSVTAGTNRAYSDKFYLAVRIMPYGSIHLYKAIGYSSISGSFKLGSQDYLLGEAIDIIGSTGSKSGHVIWVDTEHKRIQISTDATSSFLNGARIIGKTSGASANLDSKTFFVGTGGSKYLRVYENVWKGGGARAIFSTNRWFALQTDVDGNEVERRFEREDGSDVGYGVVDITAEPMGWSFVESFIDYSGDFGKGYVDVNNSGKKWFNGLVLSGYKPRDTGPTIANLGWEAAGGTDMINAAINFGEIYFDKTPQRVLLSKESLYKNARADQEIQFPVEWNDSQVKVELRKASLSSTDKVYVYVFDDQGLVNEEGLLFCEVCGSPPAAPALKVL